MNEQIPIKVTTDSKVNHQDIKKALNLNKVISDAKTRASNSAKKASFWKILTVIFLLLSIGLAIKSFWYDQRNLPSYQNIIPGEAQAVFYIKISQLNQLAPTVIPGLEQNSDYYKWLNQKISQFLTDANIDAQSELVPSLKDETVFLVFPPTKTGGLSWAIIGQSNIVATGGNQTVFGKIEDGLRKNFGTNQLFYRQIKINSVYAFNKIDKPYYYSQVDNYLVVANNLDALEKIVDKIIGN
jgi:hypothetical protein